jgi:hypothetical protein
MERDILNRDRRLANESQEAVRKQDAQQRETYRRENVGVTPYSSNTQETSIEDEKAFKVQTAKQRKLEKLEATKRPSIEGGFDFDNSNYSKIEPTLDTASTATGVPKDILAGVVAEETGFQGGSDDVKRAAIRLKRTHRELLSNGVPEDTVWNEAVRSINPENPEFESNVMKNIANLQHSLDPEDMYSIGAGGINVRDDNPYLGINSDLRRDNELSSIPENAREVEVTRVLDGDTIELSNGERVRFRNIDTPELDASNNYEGLENGAVQATNWLKTAIDASDGKVLLATELDGSQRIYDYHDRLLDSPILKDGTSSERMLRDEDLADSYNGRTSANHMYEAPFKADKSSSDGYRAGLGYDIYASSPQAVLQNFAGMTTSGDIDNPTRRRDNNLTSQQAQALTGRLFGKYSLNEEGTSFTNGKEYEGNATKVVLGTDSKGNQTLRIGDKNDDSITEGIDEISYNELMPENAALMLRDTLYGRKEARENKAATLTSEVTGETNYGERFDEYFTGNSLLGDGQLEKDEPRVTSEYIDDELINNRIREYQYKNRDGGILYEKGLEMDIDRYEDQIESDNASGTQIAGNTLNAAFARIANIALNAYNLPANKIKEKTGLDITAGDTAEETTFIANEAVNYNPTRAEEAMKEIETYAKDLSPENLYNAIKTVAETPELAGQSGGDIAYLAYGRVFGSLLKATFGGNKIRKKQEQVRKLKKKFEDGDISKEKARKSLEAIENTASNNSLLKKAIDGLADNEGVLTYIGGELGVQIQEFKANNNGDAPSESDVARMLTIATVTTLMDKGVGTALFKDKGFIKDVKDALTWMPESTKAKVAAAVPKKAAAISMAAGAEAGQEYLQTMGEIFNTQFNTWQGGDDVKEVLTDKDNQIDAISGALVGAAVGGEFRAGTEAATSIPYVMQGASEGTTRAKSAFDNAFPTQAEREARASSEDLQERNRASKESEREDLEYYQETVNEIKRSGYQGTEVEIDNTLFEAVAGELDAVLPADEEGNLGVIDAEKAEQTIAKTQKLAKSMRAAGKEDHADAILGKLFQKFKQINDAENKLSEEEKRSSDQIYGSSSTFVEAVSQLSESNNVDINDDVQQSLVDIAKGYESLDLSIEDIRKLIDLGEKEQAVKASEWSTTGKSRTQVSSEATEGPRGLLNYYRDAVIAKIQKDNAARDTAVKNLVRFSKERQGKLKKLDTKLADVTRSIDFEIEQEIQRLSEGKEVTPSIAATAKKNIAYKYDTYNNTYYKNNPDKKAEAVETVTFGGNTFDIRKYNVALGKGGVYEVMKNLAKEAKAGADLEIAVFSGSARLKDVDLGERNLARTETGSAEENEINFNDIPVDEPDVTPSNENEVVNIPENYSADFDIDAIVKTLRAERIEYIQEVYDVLRNNESMFDAERVGDPNSDQRQAIIEYLFDTHTTDEIKEAIDYVENVVYGEDIDISSDQSVPELTSTKPDGVEDQKVNTSDIEAEQEYSDAYYVDDRIFSSNESEVINKEKRVIKKEVSETAKKVKEKKTAIEGYKKRLKNILDELNKGRKKNITVEDIRSAEENKVPVSPLITSLEALDTYIGNTDTVLYKEMTKTGRDTVKKHIRIIKNTIEGCQ